MALVIADRVRETSTTTGTGAVTLAGAYTGFQSFSAGIGNGNSTYYTIANVVSGEWEVGIGTYTSSTNTLSRTTILASSNAGSAVNFSAGAKDVFVTQPAERSLLVQSAGSGLFSGAAAFTANGVPYADSTSTLVTGSGLTFNGTTLAAPNISTAGSVTLSGGTANGVLYLNGSKVATSGSALTFDGTGGFSVSTSATNGSIQVVGPSSGSNSGAQLGIVNGSTTTSLIGNYSRVIGGAYNESLAFYNNGNDFVWYSSSERMRLTSTGLGIGTSSPGTKLDVRGTIQSVASGAGLSAINSSTFYYMNVSSTGLDTYTDANASAPMLFKTGGTERMRLDSSGNLGIGTSSPGAKLHAVTSSGYPFAAVGQYNALRTSSQSDRFILSGTDTTLAASYQPLQIQGSTLYFAIGATTSATLDSSGNLGLGVTPSAWSTGKAFEVGAIGNGLWGYNTTTYLTQNAYYNGGWKYAASGVAANAFLSQGGTYSWLTAASGTAGNAITFTQAMTLDSAGRFLIGKTSFGATTTGFQVNGDSGSSSFGSCTSTLAATANANTTYEVYSTGASAYRFYVGLGGTVYATSTTITAISDQRLKENIRDLDDGLATVIALKPRKFDWKDGKGKGIKNDRGFIAQEFEQVLPDMIEEWRDPAPEGEEPYKAINANLIPTLVKAIQEQQALIETLTARVAALES